MIPPLLFLVLPAPPVDIRSIREVCRPPKDKGVRQLPLRCSKAGMKVFQRENSGSRVKRNTFSCPNGPQQTSLSVHFLNGIVDDCKFNDYEAAPPSGLTTQLMR